MTVGRFAVIAVRATVLGLIMALVFSGRELVSVEIWLAAAVVLVAGSLLLRVLSVAAVEPARITVAWTWRRRRRGRHADRRPREVRAIAGTLSSAQHNPRAHANRLRPRLAALADHFLPTRRAVDPRHDPVRASVLLGEVAWLIDPAVSDRTPTIAEIDRFLDIILAEGGE